ncbi:RagB/SusD family nutrient uptake outer membrane protein [Formosa sp. PL04]|uniref:RagB/SusD family nutrient uptake outer membrane protein n=1 Tax=Formosa sp. PL04 TaxID=3081755 RepID=UPI00298247E9|nr:RagB/SusD family nutrient uptake outer membrane protein [Formosa sp. PL04]MDW5289199.1 RagB/SusD family nutrient uptake outer membrane protein [Formosa sp. PL04]
MKYLNKIFLITLMVFICHSCSDLEEDTSSLLTLDKLATEGDITASLAPLYRETLELFKVPHFLRAATYGGDDITTWSAGNKAPLRTFDRFDYGSGENADNAWLANAWDSYWKIIYYSNTLVEGLKTSTAPENSIGVANGEARLFRAFSYLNLVRTQGNVPVILGEDKPTGKEQRATVLENYQHIEADLLIAEELLPAPGSESAGRVTSSFAKAVLADLYLTWGGWPVKDASKIPLAASKAKEIIDTQYHTLLPIDELWLLSGENSTESIFSVRVADDQSVVNNYPSAFSFHQARGFSDCFPELQFFYDFPEGPRKEATFLLDIPNRKVPGGVITPKDPPTTPWQESDRQHPMYQKFVAAEDLTFSNRPVSFRSIELYRYAEVLLIYAEAQARVGENASSVEALNQVIRRAAGLPYLTPNTDVDVTTATVDEIIAEKGWELAGEYKRWFDLVRTEKVEEIAALRDPSEPVELIRQPTKAQYIVPIPINSILLSELVQNPEGFKIQ